MDRHALHTVDQNAQSIPLFKLKTGAKPSITPIPRPAAVADVFDHVDKKRPRQGGLDYGQKRIRIEDKWRDKWLKVFPSLRFYFETDDRHLRARVASMEAKIEPFFSNQVTHLITASVLVSPGNPFTGSLAAKATKIGIKVWDTAKLADILDRIAPIKSRQDTLSTLLQDEKQNGTRERDPSALRKDYTYFPANSHFVLLQDATARTRPIMAKDSETWPTLFESFLRVSSSSQSSLPTEALRDRAWSLYVEQVPYQGEIPVRLNPQSETPCLPPAQPYANASGNSVVITSNIASTSNPSPFVQPTGKVAQMSKRVQVLKGNARAYRPPTNDVFMATPLQQKTFMPQEQVIHMLQQVRQPRRDHVSYEDRLANREKVDGGRAKDQDVSAGYCENCRMRFANLSLHLQSKKHKKFAQDAENFKSLDDFLATIARPLNPTLTQLDFPPCHEKHTYDDHCQVCDSAWEP